MVITNTTQLTANQYENAYLTVREIFEKKFTDDFWHFSFEGTRLNLKSFNAECVYEVHSEKGSFNILIDLNENKKALKSTFKTVRL